MPKSSEKAGADQPANQRGKSRFGTSGRPGRVVLPERPPRVVDNDIVAILLGGDPAALTAQAEDIKSVAPAEPADTAPALIVVEAPPPPDVRPVEALTRAEPTPVGDGETTTDPVQSASPEPVITEETGLTPDKGLLPEVTIPLSTPPEKAPLALARASRSPKVPTGRGTNEGATPDVQKVDSREVSVSSFEEFAERWRHGLRKGQLKICEVLYQKTYAVGQTECVTSFSELGRLSGLQIRQCFNIIAQLEALRFVERARSSSTSNKKDQGSVIRFHLYPVQ